MTFSCAIILTATTLAEKDRFLSSVIRALESDGPSSALARALVMRAESRLEASLYSDALQDLEQALSMPTATSVQSRAHRIAADAYEDQGMYAEAIQSLIQLASLDSGYRTKINKEIQRLQSAIR